MKIEGINENVVSAQRSNLKRIKEIVKENDRMDKCAQVLIKEGLVVSMSQGRRLYQQLK